MTAPSPGTQLRDLAATALVGIDRAGGGKQGVRELLDRAACLGLKARSGWRAGPAAAAIPPCRPDTTPVASPAATATLSRLLTNPDAAVIEEWARLALSRGWRMPDSIVPAVMNWWARQPRRSGDVYSTLGVRGWWLSSLNPEWRKPVASRVLPPDVDQKWETGTAAERAALLESVRRVEPFPDSRFFKALTLQPARNAKVARSMFWFRRSDLICSPTSASNSSMVFAIFYKGSK